MKLAIQCIVILSVLSHQALAETPTFDFVNVGYVSNIGGGVDFDGFEIKGNREINDSIYVNAGYTNSSTDRSFGNIDIDVITLGLGYKTDISDVSTLFTELDYVRIDRDGAGTADGYQIGFGVRSNISSSLELKAAGYYRDTRGTDSFLQLEATYNLTDSAGIYLNIESDIDDSSYGLGVRFSFGR